MSFFWTGREEKLTQTQKPVQAHPAQHKEGRSQGNPPYGVNMTSIGSQDGPNMAPKWPQRGPRRCPVVRKMALKGGKLAQHGPKMALDGPKVSQDNHWMRQDGLMVAPRRPQEGPRWPQGGPRRPQDGPKKAQESPKTAPRGAKMRSRWTILAQGS